MRTADQALVALGALLRLGQAQGDLPADFFRHGVFEVDLNSPEEVRKLDKGKVELVTVAGAAIGRATFEPGWKWSTCVKPIAKTNSCQAAHYGYQLSGTLTTRMDDGTERTSKAGGVLNIPPGHDAWVVGNEPVVLIDFQGMVDYARQSK